MPHWCCCAVHHDCAGLHLSSVVLGLAASPLGSALTLHPGAHQDSRSAFGQRAVLASMQDATLK